MDQCVLPWRCLSRPVGGTPALSPSSVAFFPPSPLFLSSPSLFSVFLLLFCDSITPSSSSLSLSCTNALSHHRFSQSLSPSLSPLSLSHPLLKFFPLLLHYFTLGRHPFSPLRSPLSVPCAHVCYLSATFCSGFIVDAELAPPTSPFTSTWKKTYTHE